MQQFLQVSAGLVSLVAVSVAAAQSSQRSVFVVNDGNLEGSVSSFTLDDAGVPTLVDFIVTGERDSLSDFHPGTNAHAVAISPNGEFLAVTHATGDPPFGFPPGRQLTMLKINEDATMSIHGTFQVEATPLDLTWLDDEFIAVTETSSSGLNRVWVFRFDWETNELIMRDAQVTGIFSSSLAKSPDGAHLYVGDSFGSNVIVVLEVNEDFTLTEIQSQSTGSTYPLGLGISPNGRWLYAGGGISSGGDAVIGFDIDEKDATLSLIPNAPFDSPGSSPKQVVVSDDNQWAVAGHGTDATVRTFAIHQSTGELVATGFSADAGGQGSLGNIAMLDDLLLLADRSTFTDGVQGLHCYALGSDGSLTATSPPVETQGIAANDLAVWPGASCAADLTGDSTVNVSDLLMLLAAWGACDGACDADLNGDSIVNVSDMLLLLGDWGECG